MNTSLRIPSFAALVVSVLTPGAGCYSSMPITDPSEAAGHALLVKTNGLYTYELDRWEVLENQDIVGAGMRQEDVLGILRMSPFEGRITHGSIESISVKKIDAGKTVGNVLIAGIIVTVVVGAAVLIELALHPPSFKFN